MRDFYKAVVWRVHKKVRIQHLSLQHYIDFSPYYDTFELAWDNIIRTVSSYDRTK